MREVQVNILSCKLQCGIAFSRFMTGINQDLLVYLINVTI